LKESLAYVDDCMIAASTAP